MFLRTYSSRGRELGGDETKEPLVLYLFPCSRVWEHNNARWCRDACQDDPQALEWRDDSGFPKTYCDEVLDRDGQRSRVGEKACHLQGTRGMFAEESHLRRR